jgi:hypothetical protein
MAIKTSKFMKEFKSWTTPAWSERKIFKTLGKTLLRVGKFAVRRPILTAALTYSLGRPLRKRKQYLKNKWGTGPSAGRRIMHKGDWLF